MNDVNQPPTYKEEVAQYTKKDAIHALLFAAFIILLWTARSLFFNVMPGIRDYDGYMTFMGQVVNLIMTLPIAIIPLFVLLKKKGQGLRSAGLHLVDWKKALAVGLFFVVVLLMLFDGLLPGLLGGWQMRSTGMILWFVVFVFFMAFLEDIIFVGYLQTRIYGLINNDFWAVLLVGIIFAAFHYPSLIINTIAFDNGLGADFWGNLVFTSVSWIVMHAVFNMIFRNLRSIIPVTLFHFAWNFNIAGQLWADDYGNGVDTFLSMGIAIGVVFLIVGFLKYLKKRRAAL